MSLYLASTNIKQDAKAEKTNARFKKLALVRKMQDRQNLQYTINGKFLAS